ncbi:hypothetical protein [Adhaeribacter pallidiroseus]|uniref:Lipocalin-like domain-containing protein n=1 Tax=Adhaeribacter pallidiroseus TaxID=2072847 RepID=A0A369QIX3_9BACT|nr:hypothetical protein [Adhaeribacter pallidiroseus]RDC64861.1 hypothetical protein AHMF7616_03482 [Adhaeribacter pallidiroseus]
MRNLLISFLLWALISCKPDDKKIKKDKIQVIDSHSIKIDSSSIVFKQILGKWGIYERINKGLIVNCYACPKMIFKSDSTGEIINPSKEREVIKWATDGSTLTIKNLKAIPNRTFPDGKYAITFTPKKKYADLKLTYLLTGETYILSK